MSLWVKYYIYLTPRFGTMTKGGVRCMKPTPDFKK